MHLGSTLCFHLVFVHKIFQRVDRGNRLFTYSAHRLLTGILCTRWETKYSKYCQPRSCIRFRLPHYDWGRLRISKHGRDKHATDCCSHLLAISTSGRNGFNAQNAKITRNSVHDLLKLDPFFTIGPSDLHARRKPINHLLIHFRDVGASCNQFSTHSAFRHNQVHST